MKIELFPKQEQFFYSDNKINVFCGGIQSSKTTTGALRFVPKGLLKFRSPEDNFLIAADTYKTLSQATIPTFLKYARQFGKMNGSKAEFKTKWGSTVYFRTGTEPDSVEGIPNVRRCWLDEGGKCTLYFFENIMGRAARIEAPVDITTTPYAMNWLAKLGQDAKRGKRSDVTLIHCKSVESPYFSKTEYERQKTLLDPRRFAMKYDGEFGQIEGLVYDLYENCLVQHVAMPTGTVYYAGVDWGYFPDPFCVVIRGVTPDGVHFRVAEYYRTYLTIPDIVEVMKSYHGLYKFKSVFCDPSQPAHIDELSRHGIPAQSANNDIRYGIDLHYSLMKQGKFFILQDQNPVGIDEYSTYHYREQEELGFDDDRAKKASLPVDQNNHGMDADRYLTVSLVELAGDKIAPKVPENTDAPPTDLSKRLEWLKRGGSKRYAGL